MKKTIFLTIFLTVFSFASLAFAQVEKEKHYEIHLKETKTALTYTNVIVRVGKENIVNQLKQAKATLYSFDKEELATTNFNLPSLNQEYILKLPYYPLGKEIKITNKENKELLVVNVASFARTCSDNICQDHESFASCAQDCPSGSTDGYCDGVKDNRCDQDCQTEDRDIDCSEEAIKKNKNNNNNDNNNNQIAGNVNKDNNNSTKKANTVTKQEDKQAPIPYIIVGLIVMISIFALVVALRLRRE
jgi:hypothetical protein